MKSVSIRSRLNSAPEYVFPKIQNIRLASKSETKWSIVTNPKAKLKVLVTTGSIEVKKTWFLKVHVRAYKNLIASMSIFSKMTSLFVTGEARLAIFQASTQR